VSGVAHAPLLPAREEAALCGAEIVYDALAFVRVLSGFSNEFGPERPAAAEAAVVDMGDTETAKSLWATLQE